ncbi:ATP-binding protein [Nodosilinea nodulosa]|uniref:ATP-binding protein n=1 Tax=Nodosilinea nodulosa TaxID=416001 RepID=UPI0003049022|nr:ATP-binding protein [Nodosilinea nodulosa]
MPTSASESHDFSLLAQVVELRNAWERNHSERAQGGLLSISGFEYQFLLTLLKIISLWKASTDIERQDLEVAKGVLSEAISDIIETGKYITLTQAKRTLSASGLRKALEELWQIFILASTKTPELAKRLEFVISGQLEGDENPQQVIQGWRTRSQGYPQEELRLFKEIIRYEIVPDPRVDLLTELQVLVRNEDAETTIARWLGYFLQLGSGFSPESISTLIWKELSSDGSLKAFRTTLARLFSRSQSRLSAVRETLGRDIILPRVELSALRRALHENNITLLVGPSGSGKSALCKLSVLQEFNQKFDCLFLQASDITIFTESSEVNANQKLRRLDELLNAQITQKPNLIIIDDLGDVDNHHLDAVLDLLQNTLAAGTFANVRFILVAHIDAKNRIHEKISARLGSSSIYTDVELPQLPVEELESSENLPDSIVKLIQRYQEFGPALNLKLIDWLVRSIEQNKIDIPVFRNDLDLLTWFWQDYIQNGQKISDLSRALIKISEGLADKFVPDLPCHFDPSIDSSTLHALVRRDCLHIVDERLATTHRFVGDCARFQYLRSYRREIEGKHLVERLQNPFWVQPVRWFSLQLALEEEQRETWQEIFCEALECKHLQLLDLLLDGAILSKQPSCVLQGCPDGSLSFIIERIIVRLLGIATTQYSFYANDYKSKPLQTRIKIREKLTGIPQPEFWEPIWRWLFCQDPENILEESCIVFKAAEAWLNWSEKAQEFSLRNEVAKFTLDLAQKVLLPDPKPRGRSIDSAELEELFKRKQKEIIPLPEPPRIRSYYLGDFEENAFSCIVFALRITQERATWFLRVLAGREIIPSNKLEPTEVSSFLSRPGVGILETPHPQGPSGGVDYRFRKFMLNRNGLYLNAVILTNPQLGVELFLALIIKPPSYRYENDADFDWDDRHLGIAGSDDIDVCTFKFLPLLSLLEIDEVVAIKIINILCKIATKNNQKNYERIDQRTTSLEDLSIDPLRADTHELSLIIENVNKQFEGECKTLYWHRNSPLSPKIINCLLMTLEGWLYSRPSRHKLECSVDTIFNQSDTVALLGVLVTLAKCDSRLLSGCLMPLTSSVQLLVWLEFEQIDSSGQNYVFDSIGSRKLVKEEQWELLEFNRLSYRKHDLLRIILSLWVNEVIPDKAKTKVLNNWDNIQLALVPEVSRRRALKIRAWFEPNNWKREINHQDEHEFQFVGNLPEDDETDARAENALLNLQHLQLTMTCRKIIDGEQEKTLELHDHLEDILTSDEKIEMLRNTLESKSFLDVVWASVAIILQPPLKPLNQELEADLSYLAETLVNAPFSLDRFSRCQVFNVDASAFISHIAPNLIMRLKSDSEILATTFRCLIGARNRDTSAFLRSWLEDYGFEHSLTQKIISLAPYIARLITLTHALAYARCIQKVARSDGSYIVPRPEEIDYEVGKREDLQVQEAWVSLQRDFTENKLQPITIFNASEWVPEALNESLQKIPAWLKGRYVHHSFDWEFLLAILVPIFRTVEQSDKNSDYVVDLKNQVIAELIYERENTYFEFKANEEKKHIYSGSRVHIHLYQSQSQILDEILNPRESGFLRQLDEIICEFKEISLIDCIFLEHVIDRLIYSSADSSAAEKRNISLHHQAVFAIGDYLNEFTQQSTSELKTLGRTGNAWERMIELISQEPKYTVDVAFIDRFAVDFVKRYQKLLFPNSRLRWRLYRTATFKNFKQLRRIIFRFLIEKPKIVSNDKSEESKVLVQVLAELWDSDYTWIVDRQSRCKNLKLLLSQLQKIDAVGASLLADQVADSLSNSTS